MIPITVVGSGVYLPETVISNAELTKTLDTSDDWIVSRTGIRERRRLAADLAVSDMGVVAARAALVESGVDAENLDAVIVATYTGDQPQPSTALIIATQIGAKHAVTLDITQAACANGLQAIWLAAHLLAVSASTVLVIGADCASRAADPRDRTTRVIFGDAAGAVVLTRTATPGAGLLAWDLGSGLSYAVEVRAGGSRRPASASTVHDGEHFVRMNGRAVWDTATRELPSSIRAAVEGAHLNVAEIDHFFLHQANLNILDAVMRELGVPLSRAPITVDRLGNTGSASVFTALHAARTRRIVHTGDTFVISAIGAGFQWGTLCFRHG